MLKFVKYRIIFQIFIKDIQSAGQISSKCTEQNVMKDNFLLLLRKLQWKI